MSVKAARQTDSSAGEKKEEETALGHLKIYREQYDQLPVRFQNKIDHDLNYLSNAGIPGLKKIYLFGSCARGQVRSTSDVDLQYLETIKLQNS